MKKTPRLPLHFPSFHPLPSKSLLLPHYLALFAPSPISLRSTHPELQEVCVCVSTCVHVCDVSHVSETLLCDEG